MRNAISVEVKELIRALQGHHMRPDGKPATLTDLERIYGVSRQTLKNWAEGSAEHAKLSKFIEKGRKALGWSEGFAYRKAVKPIKEIGE